MRALFFIFLLGICSDLLFAQEGAIQECGSEAGQVELSFMSSFNAMSSAQMDEDSVIYIAVNYFIARRTDGSGGLDPGVIPSLTLELNDQYMHAGIQFYPCGPIQFIDSTEYYDFTQGQEQEVCGPRDRYGVMNVYFFNSVRNNSGGGLCGYAYFPGSRRDRIVMSNACALNGSTYIHEVGHFFSLFHTHGKTNNGTTDELVNGSNCESAGDNVCDTPADPNLNGKVSRDCLYTGGASDANGDPFAPDPRNIMSYSRKECRDVLTPGQLARVNFSARFHRPYFEPCCSDTFQIKSDLAEIQCAGDSTGAITITDVNGFGRHTYQWSVPGDSSYVSKLGAGQYSVTVTDRLGCAISDTFLLTDPENPGGYFTLVPVHCDEKNGRIILDSLTGRGKITWHIENGVDTIVVLDSLSAGKYTVHLQDSFLCRRTDTLVVRTEPVPFSGLNSRQVRYCESDTLVFPAIDLEGEHWIAHWIDSLRGQVSVDSLKGKSMSAGMYFLEIRDTIWGCLTNDTIVITDSLIDVVPRIEWEISNFLLRLTDKTLEPVQSRRWNVAGVEVDSLSYIEYLSPNAGEIHVCLELDNVCGQYILCDTIFVEGFTISTSVQDPKCHDELGNLDVSIMGDPDIPYEIKWFRIDDSTSGNDLVELGSGTYMVMVSDSNGSTVDTTVEIKAPGPISLDSLSVRPSTGMNGSVYIEVSGGTPPYSYEWSQGASEARVEGLSPGSYTCQVTDGNGCTDVFGPFEVLSVTHTVQREDKIWLQVHPLPVKDVVSVQLYGARQKEVDIQLYVYNLSGEKIFEKATVLETSGRIQFDCDIWPSGMYILQWQVENEMGSVKLIKE